MKPSIFVDLNTVFSHQSSQITSVADCEINWISRGQELLYLPWKQPKQRELEHCSRERVTALLQKASQALWKIHEAKIKITPILISLIVKCNLIDCGSGSSLPNLCEQRFGETERWNFTAEAMAWAWFLQPPPSLRHCKQDPPFLWGKSPSSLPFPLLAALKQTPEQFGMFPTH